MPSSAGTSAVETPRRGVLDGAPLRIVCPIGRGSFAVPEGGKAMRSFGEALIWAAENLWALILHITGRSSFPKPLTAAEEAEYIRRMGEGDAAARDALIEHNLRLVAHIAKKYQGGALDADDMVSIGAIGLIKAVNTFRPEAGKLTTYASRCIENEILMQLRAGRKARLTVQLDDPIGTDKDEVSDAAETAIEASRALRLLQTPLLDARERRVLQMRYGLLDGAPRPQHEVAKALGLSRSYISRIEKKALEKLRGALGG